MLPLLRRSCGLLNSFITSRLLTTRGILHLLARSWRSSLSILRYVDPDAGPTVICAHAAQLAKMLIVSPEFGCSNEMLSLTAMLSGTCIPHSD